MSFIRQHKGAVVWSVMLHIAVAAAVIVGVPWRIERPPVPMAAAAPIEGVIIDQAAIERERDKREEAARQERARVQREERQRQQAQEQQRVAEQREQQRVADERRARERAEQQERDRVAAERADQQRREEQAKAEREAQARREREEADRRASEQAEQRRRAEAELQAQAAAEAAANARALEQYMAAIEEDVRRSWNRPLSAVPGLVCVVDVVQAPTGDVLTAKVNPRQCNGDEAVRRSVEDAVRDASPLPQPPTRAVFSRTFTLTFAPDQ